MNDTKRALRRQNLRRFKNTTCEEAAAAIIALVAERDELQAQIDALQQKGHLTAGYDRLLAERDRLVADLREMTASRNCANTMIDNLKAERGRLRRALEVVEEQADQSIDDGGFEMGIRHIKNIAREALEGAKGGDR